MTAPASHATGLLLVEESVVDDVTPSEAPVGIHSKLSQEPLVWSAAHQSGLELSYQKPLGPGLQEVLRGVDGLAV